jgi:cell division protein FtsW
LFLPESYGDFIFSILGEEYGFIGAVVTLLIYLTIFLAGLIIAKKATDKFGQLLAFGLSFNIIISAFINAGVVSGILPTTGITLPFISFGGTSIIVFGLSVGIILSIAKETIKKRELRLAQA